MMCPTHITACATAAAGPDSSVNDQSTLCHRLQPCSSCKKKKNQTKQTFPHFRSTKCFHICPSLQTDTTAVG